MNQNLVVITDLYPVGGRKNTEDTTDAIRNMLLDLSDKFNSITVLKFIPFLTKKGINSRRIHIDNNIVIYDVPYFLTSSVVFDFFQLFDQKVHKIVSSATHISFHMAHQYLVSKKLHKKSKARKIITLHSSDRDVQNLTEIFSQVDSIYSRSKSLNYLIEDEYTTKFNGYVISGVDIPFVDFSSFFSLADVNNRKRKLKLLYAGALIERKNVDSIIKALVFISKIVNVELVIIGDGPQRDLLESLAEEIQLENGTSINFLGNKSKKQVYQAMKDNDVFIMPSINETLGLVYLEAMANGCITIGMRNEGIDGIIKNSVNGFLLENDEAVTIYKCFLSLLNNDNLKNIAEKAYETATLYSNERATLNYYNKIIGIQDMPEKPFIELIEQIKC